MPERVVVRRKPAPKQDASEIIAYFRQYIVVKNEEEVSKARRESIKSEALFPFIERQGLEDDKGSLVLTFPEPVTVKVANKDGVKKETTYIGVKKEKRASLQFLQEVAEDWLTANNLRKKVLVSVTTTTRRPGEAPEIEETTYLDQDLIYVLNQEGKIPDEVLDSWFEEKITWALVPVKA